MDITDDMPRNLQATESSASGISSPDLTFGGNRDMALAWQLIANTDRSVFLTGKAGTGKTTFLRQLQSLLPKRMVVLAPTGVAAINAHGQTIHSFFQLPLGPISPGKERERKSSYKMSEHKKRLIRTLDLLVIDEISMVRCDLLDAIDTELRKFKNRYRPFGGVQLLLIGDLQQLAPVAREDEWQTLSAFYQSPYFFNSIALKQIPLITIELDKIYRQQDLQFINLLGRIRENSLDSESLNLLNSRCIPNFEAPQGEDWIRLTTHNRKADEYNAAKLKALPTKSHVFEAEIKGKFPDGAYPVDPNLELKEGAQVMFVKNDSSLSHAYYNGKIGTVEEISDDGIFVRSKEDDIRICVPREEWESTSYTLDKETKEIKEVVDGIFVQYPLRLAWAITVHKSQGLTFDRAILDINESFAHGQAYVALSRCRTLEGMVLSRPLNSRSIINDSNVTMFTNSALAQSRDAESRLPQMKCEYFVNLLDDTFDFRELKYALENLHRVAVEHLYRKYHDLSDKVSERVGQVDRELIGVAARFRDEYCSLAIETSDPESSPRLKERIDKGLGYFLEKICRLALWVGEQKELPIENKQVATQYANAVNRLSEFLFYKILLLEGLADRGFTVKNYQNIKARALLGEEMPDEKKKDENKQEKKKTSEPPANAGEPWSAELDIELEELYKSGKKYAEIGRLMGRTGGAIKSRLKRLGLLKI